MNATRQPNDAGGPYQLIDEFIVDVPLEDEVAPKSANPRSWTPSDGPRPEIECAYAAGEGSIFRQDLQSF